MSADKRTTERGSPRRTSGEELAGFIVDALYQAGIVHEAEAQRAIEIATEEIDVSDIMNDFFDPGTVADPG